MVIETSPAAIDDPILLVSSVQLDSHKDGNVKAARMVMSVMSCFFI